MKIDLTVTKRTAIYCFLFISIRYSCAIQTFLLCFMNSFMLNTAISITIDNDLRGFTITMLHSYPNISYNFVEKYSVIYIKMIEDGIGY